MCFLLVALLNNCEEKRRVFLLKVHKSNFHVEENTRISWSEIDIENNSNDMIK